MSDLAVHGMFLCPLPFEKGGAYCFAHVGRSVDQYVCRYVVALNHVQLII